MRTVTVALGCGLIAAVTCCPADELSTVLQPYEGQAVDMVELGTGRQLIRPKLERIVTKDDVTQSLRLIEQGQAQATTIRLPAITRIVAGRETVYEKAATGPAAKKAQQAREEYARDKQVSWKRMAANGVRPWQELSAEQHAAAIKELEDHVAEVKKLFPALVVSETHEFIMVTDILPQVIAPYVANLDEMHDFLCSLYGIPRGEPVWQGKCLVFAFQREEDFRAYEGKFFRSQVRKGTYGRCHSYPDGRVIVACYQGSRPDSFATMLVHETSHGFNHRWLALRHLPNWLNEGIAEWVSAQVVPRCPDVPRREARSLAIMQQTGSLGPGFLTENNIAFDQYGTATLLVRFLVAKDRQKFGDFVRGYKEGMAAEESLKAAYGGSLDELITAFGTAIGVPGLKP